jgi:AraC-like DNA-binding protein
VTGPLEEPRAPPFVRGAVPPSLAGLVHRITGYEAHGAGETGSREVATFVVPIVLSFAEPFRIAFDRAPGPADRIGSFVSGLHPGHVGIDHRGPVSCLQIDLTPLGARLFFGRPMSDLATRLVPLGDLGDRDLAGVRDRIGAAAGWPERLEIATAFLQRRLSGRAVAPETAFLWSAIRRSRGTLRIDRLTEDLGWSRKRLSAHARDAFGMTPKRLARIARFHHAMDLALSTPCPDWADIAADCGYADQAHLVHDFTAFAGEPPGRWWRGAGDRVAKQIHKTGGDGPGQDGAIVTHEET